MDASYISVIVEFLSPESVYFVQSGAGQDRPSRLAIALNDPKFGWNFVRALKVDGRRFPALVTHPQLLQANAYLNGSDDDAMVQALALCHPSRTTEQNILKGLLISPDVTLASIAKFMKIPLEVVRIIDQLMFNARDRRDDPGYLAALLYPDGIEVNRRCDSEELRLLRAGAVYGAEEVIRLARIKPYGRANAIERLYESTETGLLLAAESIIRHGGEEEIDSPTVAATMKLLVAAKRNQADEPRRNVEGDALTEIAEEHPVSEWLQTYAQPGMDQMIEVSQKGDAKPVKPDPNWARF